jgi:hypothetical protein
MIDWALAPPPLAHEYRDVRTIREFAKIRESTSGVTRKSCRVKGLHANPADSRSRKFFAATAAGDVCR